MFWRSSKTFIWTKDVELISQNIDIGFNYEESKLLPKITLHKAARDNSTALFMSIRCSCKDKCTGNCKCIKNNVECSVYCHNNADFVCDNDKGLQTRMEVSLKRKRN